MNMNRAQDSTAAVNPAVGIGVPVSEAHSLAFSCRGFFVRSARQVLWAGRVGRGNPRRPSDRYANLHGLPTLIGVGVSGKRNRFQRTTTMCTQATPAPDTGNPLFHTAYDLANLIGDCRAIAEALHGIVPDRAENMTLDQLGRITSLASVVGRLINQAEDQAYDLGSKLHDLHLQLMKGACS